MFDSSRIFVHALQYHWHAVVAEGVTLVDQEARELIVLIADLLDHFRHLTKLYEEELWAHSQHLAEGSRVIHLLEPMEARLANLQKKVYETDTRTLTNQLKITSNRQYLNQQLYQVNKTLTNLVCWMHIVEEIMKKLEPYVARAHCNQYQDSCGS